jgi:hypothetical protein
MTAGSCGGELGDADQDGDESKDEGDDAVAALHAIPGDGPNEGSGEADPGQNEPKTISRPPRTVMVAPGTTGFCISPAGGVGGAGGGAASGAIISERSELLRVLLERRVRPVSQ